MLRDGVHGQCGGVGHGLHPLRIGRATTGRDDPLHTVGEQTCELEVAPDRETGCLVYRAPHLRRPLCHRQAREAATAIHVVQGHPFAAHMREEHRHLPGIHLDRCRGLLPRRRLQDRGSPVLGDAPGVGRSADEGEPLGRVRHGPEPGELDPLCHHGPGDERGTEDHQHVSGSVGPGDHLLREGIDDPGTHGGTVESTAERRGRPDGFVAPDDGRQLRRTHPDRSAHGFVPASEVEHGQRRHGGHRVDGPHPAQGRVGDGLGGPVAGGIGVLLGQPPEHPEELAVLGGAESTPRGIPRGDGRLDGPAVAVEESG